MPFDDDAEADHPGFRPPPHPDDRLWRHPSEMRSHPITPIDGGAPRPAPPHATTPGGRRWRGARVMAGGVVGAGLAWAALAAFGVGQPAAERPAAERPAAERAEAERATLDPSTGVIAVPGAPSGRAADGAVVAVSTADTRGSGVVLRDGGVVVTSAALVPAGTAPTVELSDGSRPAVDVVGIDEATGLAVLDLEGDGYVPRPLTDGEIGEIGVPHRFVGPTGAELDGLEITGDADGRALGTPVVDGHGAVVGVTTAVDEGEAWYVAPAAVIERITDDLLADGAVDHAWLGIEGADAPDGVGVLVASVVPGGPAADSGLGAGDRVVALDGTAVADMAALLVALRTHAPGERVDLTTVRDDGGQVTRAVRLAPAPSP